MSPILWAADYKFTTEILYKKKTQRYIPINKQFTVYPQKSKF